MLSFSEKVRQRAEDLVSRAYTSIGVEDYSQLIGMSVDEAIKHAEKLDWKYDQSNKMILPKKTVQEIIAPTPSEEQLKRLAEYVSFLEN